MAKDSDSTLDECLAAVDAMLRMESAFEASCDFLLACELMGPRRNSEAVRKGTAHWPIRSYATCACLALELALKARTSLDEKTPKKTHRFSALFAALSRPAQEDVAAGFVLDGQAATVPGLMEVLQLCDQTFDTWRYRHEHRDADFYEGHILAVTRAVHESILRLEPQWRICQNLLS